jgi:hypothetical protein
VEVGEDEVGAPAAEGVAGVVNAVSRPPRFLSAPARASSLGVEAAEFAAQHGVALDDHQRLILDVTMGRTAEGGWATFENAIVEPRQNGKSHALIVRALFGAFELGEELVLFSAHQWATVNEAFLTM